MIYETQEQAQQACREWQERLKLQHWFVKVRICRHDDMGMDETCGTCRWVLSRAEALLKLLDPIDYPTDGIVEQDHEITVVHELLHIHFAPFTSELKVDSIENIFMERATEQIARTLVALKREAMPDEPTPLAQGMAG